MDGLTSKLEVTFWMVLCLSTSIIFSVGWYVDIRASEYVAFNKKGLNRLQVQELGIQVELGNDATSNY